MGTSILIFSVLGGLVGGALGLVLLWLMADKAQQQYPHASIMLPESLQAQAAADLAAWAATHGYQAQPSLVDQQPCYRKGRGWLTSATEIRLHPNGQLDIVEVVNFLVGSRRFALNAPAMLGQPVRRHKLKAVNQLLAQWQLPPLVIEAAKVGVKIKK